VAALAIGAAGVQELVRRTFATRELATGPAEWIWDRDRHRQTTPWAFWAVRDFELEEVPASAHLLVRADESYVVHLNGRRIGSGSDRDGAPLDRYRATPWLHTGGNRLAVELRSERGAGGLLLALTVEGRTTPLVWTDRRWTVFRQDHPGILGGWLPTSKGEPVMSWGLPPVGRWGVPWEVADRPPFPEVVGEGWASPPAPARRVITGLPALQALQRHGGVSRGWRPVALAMARGGVDGAPGDGRAGEEGLGAVILFDWGREVTGYLSLAHRAGGRRPAGVLRVGTELPQPRVHRPDAVVLTPPEGELWRDASLRRFRYALVLGADSVVAAWVEPAIGGEEDLWMQRMPGPPGPPAGVLGLDGPELVTPVEHEVRRKLQRLAGGARREDL